MSSELRVAISGKSGCGNSTVSRRVADRLGVPMINYTFKDLARENNMSFEEVCAKAEEGPEFDYLIDRMQVEMAEKGPCVLGSRLAIWLLRDEAFTVYLAAPPETRAARIAVREGIPYALSLERMNARDARDRERYLKLYDWDIDDYAFARLVVDAAALDPDAITDLIVKAVREG
jgi:cytidylate kinase